VHENDDHETGLEVRVLVTGATGFIGLHLVKRLVEAGREVVCLVRPTSRCEELNRLPVRLVEGDVASGAGLAEGLAGCDVVVHLAGRVAGRTRDDFQRANGDGVRHVVRASGECNSPPVVVLVSSLAAAGPARAGRPAEPGDEPRPVSYYGESKLAGEAEARALAERVPVTIVRPPIVFGGGDRASFEWFRSVARFRLHVVPGLRAERYSVVHVEDLVGALVAAAERGRRIVAGSDPATLGNGVYYVAADETPTYGEIGDYVAAGLGGRRFLKLPVPKWALRVAGIGGDCVSRATGRPALLGSDKVREAVAGSWLCSAATARSELGFVPAKGLAERFAATAAWYRENGWL
jgi:nucleoside-diphosphate-sugar epimerase